MADQPESLFEQPQATPAQEQQPEAPAVNQPQDNGFADLLSSIKREDGSTKYADVPSALKGAADAQDFIATLKQEKAELTAKLQEQAEALARAKGAEEVLAKLDEQRNEPVATPAPSLNPEDLTTVVESVLSQREVEAQKATNTKSVVNYFAEKYGDKAGEVFYAKAKEAGYTPEEINQVAANKPNSVYKLLDETPSKPQKPLESSVRTDELLDKPRAKVSVMDHADSDTLISEWQNCKSDN